MPTPTHHYTFDIDGRDSGVSAEGTNHGALKNGASIVADPYRGNVLDLDGIDDYVSLGASNVPGGSTSTSIFSIAGWVKIAEKETHHGGIYGEYNSGGDHTKNHFFLPYPSDQVAFGQYPPIGGGIVSLSSVEDGTWHHVAYVQNEPGTFKRKLYVDGSLETFDNSPEAYAGTTPNLWTIGARLGDPKGGPTHIPMYMLGRIDDLRFYDVALNADQIAVLAIPEPSTLVLLCMGVLGLLAYAWRRRRR